jgi:hypothetical protein
MLHTMKVSGFVVSLVTIAIIASIKAAALAFQPRSSCNRPARGGVTLTAHVEIDEVCSKNILSFLSLTVHELLELT